MEDHNNVRYAVGVDVGGSHFCSAVVDLQSGKLVGEPFTTHIDSSSEATVILDALVSNILTSIALSGKSGITSVGLAFPGPFDYLRGISTVHGVSKYERIFGLDVSLSLYQSLFSHGICSFRFVNDASAFALGESAGGAAREYGRVMAITLGTGVGSGFVSGHELVESGDDVPLNGWVYHLPFENGIVDEAFSTRWICHRYQELTGETVAGAKDVVDRYDEEEEARILFHEYGQRLAGFAAPLLKQFRADALVLGGNISRAYSLFGKDLEEGLADKGCKVAVKTSGLLDKAAMIGAASLFLK